MPENIDPNLCTHIIYGYAILNPETFAIQKQLADGSNYYNDFYERVAAFRKKGVKVLISIGGLSDSVGVKYYRLLTGIGKHGTHMNNFISSVITFLNFNNFDGIDLEVCT